MARRLKLDDQGFLEFYEGTAGGKNKVTVQGPTTLASDYTVTLPNAQGAANTFLKNDGAGGLTWGTSTATLQSAYNNGAKIDADGTQVEIEVAAASGNVALLLDQDDDQHALSITKDGTAAGSGANILNAGTGNGVFLDQDGNGIALNIDSEATSAVGISLDMVATATGDAIDIVQAGDAIGIDLNKTGTGVGVALDVQNVGTGDGVFLNQDGNGIALNIDSEATTAAGINVDMAAAATGDAINIVQAGDAIGIDLNKTGTGAGTALSVTNAGTGIGLVVKQDGAGIGVHIDNNGTTTALFIESGNELCIDSRQDGTGGSTAHNFLTGVNQTGSNLFLNTDGNATALIIDSEATSKPLIDIRPVTGNSRGDIAFSTARTAAPSSPSEGDIWYDGTLERFSLKTGAVFSPTIRSRYGPQFYPSVEDVTIATGAVTISQGRAQLNAEIGTTDTLDTLNTSPAAQEGDTVILTAVATDTITVSHGTGNIFLDGAANKTLDSTRDTLTLMRVGSEWVQVAFSNNS